jgi:hypothetical protein
LEVAGGKVALAAAVAGVFSCKLRVAGYQKLVAVASASGSCTANNYEYPT